jgi:hypothetical protein
MYKTKTLARLAGLVCAVGLSVFASAQTDIHFYTLGTTQMNLQTATNVANYFGFTEERAVTGAPLPVWTDANGTPRMTWNGSSLQVIPDLPSETKNGPTNDAALRYADAMIGQFGLTTNDNSTWTAAQYINWGKEAATPKGSGPALTPIKVVRFQRMLDGLPVFGKTSQLSLESDAQGITGFMFNQRPVEQSTLPAVQKTANQINFEYNMYLNEILKTNPGTATIVSKTLCYLDQDLRYVQPAYRYRVQIRGAMGDIQAEEIYVLLATNTPEPLLANRYNGLDPIGPDSAPNAGIEAPGASHVSLGEYVVRNDADQGICLNIANDFYSQSSSAASSIGKVVSRSQFYWDVQWLWMNALGISDNSQYYPGKVNFATIICHGVPWGFSCLSNYAEWVDLHNMDHYGANYSAGNPSHDYTSYMLFTACSMMPAPGDPYGGNYSSGSPFDVYWNIFWGMHGMFGYRSTAGKQDADTSFSNFGQAAGAGFPLVAAWMNATGSLDHSSGWNYGTAVINSGREGDTMYDIENLPAASSLTMWWNHA